MIDHYILGPNKETIPTDVLTWSSQFERQAERIVNRTTIKVPNRVLWWLGLRPDYWVSTVFLGLNHNWDKEGPPHLFETMVFRRWPKWKSWLSRPGGLFYMTKEPPWYLRPLFRTSELSGNTLYFPRLQCWSEDSEQDCERCSTWSEAERQHEKVVAKWEQICKSGKVVNDNEESDDV